MQDFPLEVILYVSDLLKLFQWGFKISMRKVRSFRMNSIEVFVWLITVHSSRSDSVIYALEMKKVKSAPSPQSDNPSCALNNKVKIQVVTYRKSQMLL